MIAISKLLGHSQRVPELFSARQQTPAWKDLTRRYLEVGSAAYPCQISLRRGGKLQINGAGELKVFWQVFVRHCYSLPRACQMILDAGANVGLFAVWTARQLPSARIVSLEPCLETFQSLERNIQQNDLQQRIRPIRCALAGKTGERLMNDGAESPNRRLVLEGMKPPAGKAVPVPCLTLSDFLDAQKLEVVDLLKMDIEGSEWEVLFATPPAVLSKFQNIALEYHEVNARFGYEPKKLFAHLAGAGHRMTRHEQGARRTGLAFFQRSN
jgi:FkbM family methyltransferase